MNYECGMMNEEVVLAFLILHSAFCILHFSH